METNQNTETKKPSNPSVYPDPMRGALESASNQAPWQLESGITLRDEIAIRAMQGMISNPNYGIFDGQNEVHIPTIQQCYNIADAMLKQREIENL